MDKEDNLIPRAVENAVENGVITRRAFCRNNVRATAALLNRFGIELDKPLAEAAVVGIVVEDNRADTFAFLSKLQPSCELVGHG